MHALSPPQAVADEGPPDPAIPSDPVALSVPAAPALPAVSVPADSVPFDPAASILRHTLAIATADTDDEVISRTLAAACDLIGATVAAIVGDAGAARTHGDPMHRSRLAAITSPTRRALRRDAGGLTEVLAGIGLPAAVTASFGDQVLVIAHPQPGRLGLAAGSLLAQLGAHAQASRQRLGQLDQLHRTANSDPLTGLRHHRPFEERLAVASSRTALIAIDIDEFKKINDEYGHQAGDHALVTLVAALRSALRDQDELYRIGGDEFAVAVDVRCVTEVAAIARRLVAAARRVGQTISLGAAIHAPGETGRETLRRADQALYEAKRAGGDTFRLAAQASHTAASPGRVSASAAG